MPSRAAARWNTLPNIRSDPPLPELLQEFDHRPLILEAQLSEPPNGLARVAPDLQSEFAAQRVQSLLDKRLCVGIQRIVGSMNHPLRPGEHHRREPVIHATAGSAAGDPEQLGRLHRGFTELPRVAPRRRALRVAKHRADASIAVEDQRELEAGDVVLAVVEPLAGRLAVGADIPQT
jgi:hypothetical protein